MKDLLVLLGLACGIAGAVVSLTAAFSDSPARLLLGQLLFLSALVIIVAAGAVRG